MHTDTTCIIWTNYLLLFFLVFFKILYLFEKTEPVSPSWGVFEFFFAKHQKDEDITFSNLEQIRCFVVYYFFLEIIYQRTHSKLMWNFISLISMRNSA